MTELLVPVLLTCGPTFLSTAALADTFARYRQEQHRLYPVLMVCGAWLVSTYAATVLAVRPLIAAYEVFGLRS